MVARGKDYHDCLHAHGELVDTVKKRQEYTDKLNKEK
jgi:hypothetical protein